MKLPKLPNWIWRDCNKVHPSNIRSPEARKRYERRFLRLSMRIERDLMSTEWEPCDE